MTDALAIETSRLAKAFGPLAPSTASTSPCPAGSVYGILGPNGAGKTTTIRILATLVRPDVGSARVLGHDVVSDADAVRGAIRLTGQSASIDADLTGFENLVLIGRLLGLTRARAEAPGDRAARRLRSRRRRPAGWSSRGPAACAAGSTWRPEPRRPTASCSSSTSRRPASTRAAATRSGTIVRALVADGTTVLLTTQYLEEADQLADRVAVFDHGRVVAEGPPRSSKRRSGGRAADPPGRPRRAPRRNRLLDRALGAPVRLVRSERDHARRRRTGAGRRRGRRPRTRGVAVADFALGQPSLDEVFLALTDRHERQTGGRMTATPTTHDHRVLDRARRIAHRRARAPSAPSLAFAWRRVLKVKHVPEQALDVRRHPDRVHPDVHLPVRRCRSQARRASTCGSCCPARW